MFKGFIRRMRIPPTNSFRADESYFEKLLRYIPGDIVAGWVALNGVIVGEAGNSPILQWIVFGALLILSPLYMCYMKTDPPGISLHKAFPCLVAALAFAVWVFALGGPFAAQWPTLYKPVFGSVLLILTTLIIPVLEKIFYDTTPPAQ
ncbi:MAG TPA: hypothetical protein EYN91_18345 [Candidatus Melainabacteria bacterium]|jgi:hypothetical protein|nr:hypothetical protein [Candidatus Melainabacteria bacterium]HIN63817.1 hypothetical protein [Candidatus Obscuribacterales bacterium]